MIEGGVTRLVDLMSSKCDALILHTALMFWNVASTEEGKQVLSSSALPRVLDQLLESRLPTRPLCTCISPHRWSYQDRAGTHLEIVMGEGELHNQVEDVMRAGVLLPLKCRLMTEPNGIESLESKRVKIN